MPDELNGRLLRLFADAERPLADAHFVSQINERLRPLQGDPGDRLRAILRTTLRGALTGLAVPVRLRHAAVMAVAAAALTLWALLA